MRKANWHKTRKTAVAILKEVKISEPPVRLAPILRYLDLQGQKINLTHYGLVNVSAFISFEEGIVFYKENDPTVRKRFSVAHEIGHYLLEHAGHSVSKDGYLNSNRPDEVEANMFAAELLMPYEWIKEDIKNKMLVHDIAWKYWVSKEAVGWRMYKSDGLLLQ